MNRPAVQRLKRDRGRPSLDGGLGVLDARDGSLGDAGVCRDVSGDLPLGVVDAEAARCRIRSGAVGRTEDVLFGRCPIDLGGDPEPAAFVVERQAIRRSGGIGTVRIVTTDCRDGRLLDWH